MAAETKPNELAAFDSDGIRQVVSVEVNPRDIDEDGFDDYADVALREKDSGKLVSEFTVMLLASPPD